MIIFRIPKCLKMPKSKEKIREIKILGNFYQMLKNITLRFLRFLCLRRRSSHMRMCH